MRRTPDGGILVDRVRLLQLRDELRTERTELKETLSAVEAALIGVEKLLVRSAPPETREAQVGLDAVLEAPSHPAPTDEPPRGSRAVETILLDTNVWMTAQELAAAQIERGWPPESSDPVSAVRAAANRLVASKPDLFVREHGRYRYQGQSDRQSSLNGDDPDTAQAQASAPLEDRQSSATDRQTDGDWRSLSRTEAVARMLTEAGEPLSPRDLTRMLQKVGRDDSPLAVGKALNHLYRKQRANTVARAKWVPTTDVSQEQAEASSDQETSPAVLTFAGDSQQPDRSYEQ
jgi:hypothetical protein